MHLILTGATGLVGSAVLHHILSLPSTTAASKNITRLSIIARRPDVPLLTHPQRPTANTHTKIEIITHPDFKTFPTDLVKKLTSNTDDGKLGMIWALGISQNQVGTSGEYIEITHDYAMAAANALSETLGASPSSSPSADTSTNTNTNANISTGKAVEEVKFIYVSGEGATHSPGRFTPIFGKTKGQTELDLLELSRARAGFKVYNARPAGVDAANQKVVDDAVREKDAARGLALRLAKLVLLPVMRYAPGLGGTLSPTEELGAVLTELAVGDGGALKGSGVEGWEGRVVRNTALRRMFRELTS